VKVDLVQYSHPIIADIEMVDGIRMYSDKDIAAMKINAILGRGMKKDFWDLFELLKLYSLNDIINFYNQKYPNQQLLISIPNALTYFEDADDSPDPIGLLGQTWEDVKEFIRARVSDFLKY
jgi:predicted nucleotidyltransferase component of viral defense system